MCPDVFGLKAFDEKMPVTRILPGSSPCELRLLIPDTSIGQDGFHDVVIIGSSTWRSRHVLPSDVIAIHRRWHRAVFQVMKERSVELEDLRRQAFAGLQSYRYTGQGYCPVCKIRTENSLDSHMMCYHLDLGQLWRCPVEWCVVWKGSVRECRDHFNDKHSGSESGRRLIHKYWVYQDPLPHPALREGRITKLLSFVNRAMVIAQLTHLRIAIPSSGNPPGEVPSDCFPKIAEPGVTKTPKRVSFASVIQITTGIMDPPTTDQYETPTDNPMITICEETARE